MIVELDPQFVTTYSYLDCTQQELHWSVVIMQNCFAISFAYFDRRFSASRFIHPTHVYITTTVDDYMGFYWSSHAPNDKPQSMVHARA